MKLGHRLSALLQLHLYSQLNTWLQWTRQRQKQDETRNIYVLGLGASYIRELTVCQVVFTPHAVLPEAGITNNMSGRCYVVL